MNTALQVSEQTLIERAAWIRRETIRIHSRASGVRLASSLSPVELFSAMFYGGIFRWQDPGRDRIVFSKGHGSIAMYAIFTDLGIWGPDLLASLGEPHAKVGTIPDSDLPGYITNNGSLGHGLGVACGIALAMRLRGDPGTVFVLNGDGECNEGSVWEAIMFAAHHHLDNLVLLIDDNKTSMLNRQDKILGLFPIEDKIVPFGWDAQRVDGHDAQDILEALTPMARIRTGRPHTLVLDTVKGKGVPELEANQLSHVLSLSPTRAHELIEGTP